MQEAVLEQTKNAGLRHRATSRPLAAAHAACKPLGEVRLSENMNVAKPHAHTHAMDIQTHEQTDMQADKQTVLRRGVANGWWKGESAQQLWIATMCCKHAIL